MKCFHLGYWVFTFKDTFFEGLLKYNKDQNISIIFILLLFIDQSPRIHFKAPLLTYQIVVIRHTISLTFRFRKEFSQPVWLCTLYIVYCILYYIYICNIFRDIIKGILISFFWRENNRLFFSSTYSF